MSNERTNGMLGFLAGAAIGAALGVLFAPRAGKETRAMLRYRASTAKEDLDEMIEQARVEWEKAKGKVADTATMTKDEVSDFIHFLLEEGKDLKDRLSEERSDGHDGGPVKGNTHHSAN
jgi:gas vesicle protein